MIKKQHSAPYIPHNENQGLFVALMMKEQVLMRKKDERANFE